MSLQPKYLLDVGEADRLRLEILGKVYNPITLEFLRQSGLKPGMQILDIGCGVGDMACALAQAVQPHGKVTAIDISKEQLEIAQEKAKKLGIINVEFQLLSIEHLADLHQKYDLVYARWVLIFLTNPQQCLQYMLDVLKPGGILSCEDCSVNNFNVFSYPPSAITEFFNAICLKNFTASGLILDLGDSLYQRFKQLNCEDIKIKFHQPVLLTPEEKSVIRLGIISNKKTALKLETFSEEVLQQKINDAILFEQQDNLLAFIRNTLISGKK